MREACLRELPDILVGGAAGGFIAAGQVRSFVAAILRIRSGFTFSVHRIKGPTIGADADRIGIPPGGNQSQELALAPVRIVTGSTISPEFDNRQIVCAGVGYVESLSVRRNRDAIRRRAFESKTIREHAGRSYGVNFFKNVIRLCTDDRHCVLAVFGHEEAMLIRTERSANGLAA